MNSDKKPACSTRNRAGVGIIDLHTNLSAHYINELKSCVESHLGSGKSSLVLNCISCDYICSSGIGVLAGLLTSRPGIRLAIANPGRKFKEILQLVQLDDLIQFYADEDEAVRSLSAV